MDFKNQSMFNLALKLQLDKLKRKNEEKENVIKAIWKHINKLKTVNLYQSDPHNGDGIRLSTSAYWAYENGEAENQAWEMRNQLNGYEKHVSYTQIDDNTARCDCGELDCEEECEDVETECSLLLEDPDVTLEEKNAMVMKTYKKYGDGDCSYGSPLELREGTLENFYPGVNAVIDFYFAEPKKSNKINELYHKKNTYRNQSNYFIIQITSLKNALKFKQKHIEWLCQKCMDFQYIRVYTYFSVVYQISLKKINVNDKEDKDYSYGEIYVGDFGFFPRYFFNFFKGKKVTRVPSYLLKEYYGFRQRHCGEVCGMYKPDKMTKAEAIKEVKKLVHLALGASHERYEIKPVVKAIERLFKNNGPHILGNLEVCLRCVVKTNNLYLKIKKCKRMEDILVSVGLYNLKEMFLK